MRLLITTLILTQPLTVAAAMADPERSLRVRALLDDERIDNVWTDVETGLKWKFNKASGKLPPRIKRVPQRLPPEPWEMEPIGRVSKISLPES